MKPIDEGRLIGWNAGDGSIYPSGGSPAFMFMFAPAEYRTCEVVRSLLESLDQQPVTVRRHEPIYGQPTDIKKIDVSRKVVVDLFAKWGYSLETRKTVTPQLLAASDDVKIGFLQGYFSSDGHIGIRKPNSFAITLTTVHEELAKGTTRLLADLGIKAGYRKYDARPRTFPGHEPSKTRDSYVLVVRGWYDNRLAFHELIGFPWAPLKQERLEERVQVYLTASDNRKCQTRNPYVYKRDG